MPAAVSAVANGSRVAARYRIRAHVDQAGAAGVLRELDERRGAARAAASRVDQATDASAGFFDFFLEPLASSSPVAGASVSGRSSSVTSARGALSPLRKPILRMRR